MAKTVDLDLNDLPATGRSERYPWSEWLDGQTWELVPGDDFPGEDPSNFRSTVYTAAERHGVEVTTRVKDGNLLIQKIGEVKAQENGGSTKKKRKAKKAKKS